MPHVVGGSATKEILVTLVFQGVLGLALLVGLITIIMSSKNWHWTQLTLVLFVFFTGVGYVFLAAETFRIHKNLRAGISGLQKQIDDLEKRNDDLVNGVGDSRGIVELEHRLQIVTRERGRVWRGVVPAGQMGPQGEVPVQIAKPNPHGLEKDAIVFAFEAGNPVTEAPVNGPQYLGEFRVREAQEGGVLLESVLLLGNRERERLARSQGPWSLYETMPIDRHRLFTGIPPESLARLVPEASAEEYLRHGTEATDNDDEWHVIGVDANGKRVGPENMDQAVKMLYDRSLRDYSYIFNKLASETIVAVAKQAAVKEDNDKLAKSLAGAEETAKFRQQQIEALNRDVAGMKVDRAAIEEHRDVVLNTLDHFENRIEGYLRANSELAQRLTQRQLQLESYINSVAPAP